MVKLDKIANDNLDINLLPRLKNRVCRIVVSSAAGKAGEFHIRCAMKSDKTWSFAELLSLILMKATVGSVHINVDLSRPTGELRHFWKSTGYW